MKVRQFVSLRWVLFVALMPLVVAVIYLLWLQLHGLVRYDKAYFAQEYQEKYAMPGPTALALEGALKSDDQALIAELQGLRRPASFETSPKMAFTMLWERTDRYISYMYFDIDTYYRHMHYFEQVEGRWVVSPTDLYYMFYSGGWLKVFTPLSIVWWLVGTIVILVMVVFQISARLREGMLPGGQGAVEESNLQR